MDYGESTEFTATARKIGEVKSAVLLLLRPVLAAPGTALPKRERTGVS